MNRFLQPLKIRGVVTHTLRTVLLCLLVTALANSQVARAQDDRVAELVKRAERARYAYNWKSAQKLANEALELDPNEWRAHVVLGGVAKDRGIVLKTDPAHRSALFSECVAEYRRALSIEYVLGVAQGSVECALSAGDPSSALQLSDELEQWFASHYSPGQLAKDGNYAICRSMKAQALAALGRQAEAIAAYESSVRAGLAVEESGGSLTGVAPYLRAYNGYRVKAGLPAFSANQLTAATAESVAAELNLSSASSTSTAISNPGISAAAQTDPSLARSTAQEPTAAAAAPPAQLPPVVAPQAGVATAASDTMPCLLEMLSLEYANNDDAARVDALYSSAEKLKDAGDLRGICNIHRTSLPIYQRLVARLEQLLSMAATCPGAQYLVEDNQVPLDMARSEVVDTARKIESCPPEQHHWLEISVDGELRYLLDAQVRTVSDYPAVWVRVPNDGKPTEQLIAFDCSARRYAAVATISYTDPASASVSGWAFAESFHWESNANFFAAMSPKVCR